MLSKTSKIIKRERLFTLSFLLSINLFCQQNNFIEALNFKKNIEIKDISNNPYKLITECFFNKTLENEFIWGGCKLHSNYSFNVYDIKNNKTKKIKIDYNKLKDTFSKRDFDELNYYGFSTMINLKTKALFDVGNKLYIFNNLNEELTFQKKITISDELEYNFIFAINDTTIILLDYRASFDLNKKIKAYSLNLITEKTELIFETEMSSNSACYDRANTKYYDVNKKYFLLTDNLKYRIDLYNTQTKRKFSFYKDLNISNESLSILNPNGIRKNTLDSVSIELDKVPRIVNTQFLNDTDIVVNYATKAVSEKNGIKIKNSTVDLLTIRNDSIVLKKTYYDIFYYEQINYKSSNKINEGLINPYLRSELYHLFINNSLLKVTFKQLLPKSNMSFEKYIRKAKNSILNLKSNLIFSIYEFSN